MIDLAVMVCIDNPETKNKRYRDVAAICITSSSHHDPQHTMMDLPPKPQSLSPGDPKPYSEEYFQQFLKHLRTDLEPQIPQVDESQKTLFLGAASSVVKATELLQEQRKVRDSINKDTDASKEEKDAASKAVDQAEAALEASTEVSLEAAKPILSSLFQPDNVFLSIDQKLLFQCAVIRWNGPKQLADFCAQGPEQIKAVDDLLNNVAMMKEMLEAGMPKNCRFDYAMFTYSKIRFGETTENGSDANQELFHRLALATAMEIGFPTTYFDQPDRIIDPVSRFHHYKDAFLYGELDSAFPDFTTWDLRGVIDCDAPNEQLGWGREFLRNYRPDICLMDDYQWRYCYAVRSDVPYKHPEWGPAHPRTYQQLISGGGECGPRAWFGRFMCKSWGVPTWGVRQPGHAAMTHWTPNGWVVCLGATWKYCTWNGRWGPDFLLESQARERRDDYFKVVWLELMGNILNETPVSINEKASMLDPESFWCSLALMQKKVLAALDKDTVQIPQVGIPTQWEGNKSSDDTNGDCSVSQDERTIIIPATTCSKPKKPSGQVMFMKSFLGGMQLHLRDDGSVEYQVPAACTHTKYMLTCRIVTVHANTQPLLLVVDCGSTDDPVSIISIQVPYTIGLWAQTSPVEIELGKMMTTLTFSREKPAYGLALKDITLTPCG